MNDIALLLLIILCFASAFGLASLLDHLREG